jgi:hypothetical protein
MFLIGIVFGSIQNAVLMGFIIDLIFGSVFFLIPASYYLTIAINAAKKNKLYNEVYPVW